MTDTSNPAPYATTTPDADVAPKLGMALGVVFLAIGIIGFVITGFDDFFDHHTGEKLLWFEINPAHNIVHLLFGVLGVTLSRTIEGTRNFGTIVGVGYLGALVYGVIALDETWDFLSINAADNWLHLVLALAGFGLAALAHRELRGPAARQVRASTAARPRST